MLNLCGGRGIICLSVGISLMGCEDPDASVGVQSYGAFDASFL